MSKIISIEHHETFGKPVRTNKYIEYMPRVNSFYIIKYESGVKSIFSERIGLPKKAKKIVANNFRRLIKETSGTKYTIRIIEYKP